MADIDVRFYQLVIDCADPRSLAAFWMRFTGFEIGSAHDDWVSIRSPDDGTRIAFQRVPESKAGKNRLHVDFVAKDEASDRARDRGDRCHAALGQRRSRGSRSSSWPTPRATSSASCATSAEPGVRADLGGVSVP